ncbi:MAG: DUF6340 family protein [Dysgonamonadaceae bacterium]|jgi:tetratricopeptide (TPR) repeat protein|nr:DUF6340 family protein [Dysgonamonadaceae bacterium]
MKKTLYYILALLFLSVVLNACGGIKYLTIETQEPAKVTLPNNIRSVLIVNNTTPQPDHIGHALKRLGKSEFEDVSASADSLAVYFTEALSQFLDEEEFFDDVLYYKHPLRNDSLFLEQVPIMPDEMNRLRNEAGADAIISLDQLLFTTVRKQHFRQEGAIFADIVGKVQAILRVYQPSMEGEIPVIQYTDSVKWAGYDLENAGTSYNFIFDEDILPSEKEAMKELAVRAAEKASNSLSPHWETQNRWLYTLQNKWMQDGMVYAERADWTNAIDKWTQFYNGQKNKLNKAKAANNIALAYEMQGDMTQAKEWVSAAYDLFSQSATPGSFDIRRIVLYKNEIERRAGNENILNGQIPR